MQNKQCEAAGLGFARLRLSHVKGLVLYGCGHFLFHRKMSEKAAHMLHREVLSVLFAMKKNVPVDPVRYAYSVRSSDV